MRRKSAVIRSMCINPRSGVNRQTAATTSSATTRATHPRSDRCTGVRSPVGTKVSTSRSAAGRSGSQTSPSRNARCIDGAAPPATAASGSAGMGSVSSVRGAPRSASTAAINEPRLASASAKTWRSTPRCSDSSRSRKCSTTGPRRGSSAASSTRSHSLSSPIDRLLRFADPTRATTPSTIMTFE